MNANQNPDAPLTAAQPLFPQKQKRRWLLWLARRCYFWFLRSNGWRSVLLPSPLKGHGLVLKWEKRVAGTRYCLTTEDALHTESKLHQAWQRVQAGETAHLNHAR